MWMPFTERRAGLGVLLLALLAGCAGKAARDDGAEWTSAGAPGPITAVPAPEVSAENARAFEAAVAALQAGDSDKAEVLLLEITASQPELAGPWVNLGQVYLTKGDMESARQAFERAVAANPASCEAHTQLGVMHRQVGDFATAEEHYRACLEQVPGYADAYLNLGILYELYLGRLSDALAVYRQYQTLANDPDQRVEGWVMDLERRVGS